MALFEDERIETVALLRMRTGLGDLLCTVPALRALRARLPHAHVALVTWEEMRPVVERLRPPVDELLAFPGWPGIPERPPRQEDLPAFLAAARARRFDLALQVYGANPAANAAVAAFGARVSGGFFVPGAGPTPDGRTHLPYPHHLHEVDRLLALVGHLGAPPAGAELAFPVTRLDLEAAQAVRATAGLDGQPYALVHPGATSASRRWPAERFAAVADGLRARGLAVALTGVPAEAERCAAVAAAMRAPAVNLCGATDLGAFAALLRDAALLVASDTGAAHLAAALRVPSVTVFLSGDPRRWRHSHPRHRIARVQVECNPCPHLDCPIDFRCATRLEPAAVLAEVESLLRAGLPPRPAVAA